MSEPPHHSGALYSMADDHNDTSSVVLKDSRCGTLDRLTVTVKHAAERNVDAAWNVAFAEAGDQGVKEHFIFLKAHQFGEAQYS